MSNAAINWARPLTLAPVRKAVLLNLAERANAQTGRCWPCMRTIARETGYCVRAVRLALRYLETAGLIRTLRQVGRRSIYWVTFGVMVQPGAPLQLDLDLPQTAAAGAAPPRNPVPGIQPSKDQPSEEPEESAHARAPADPPPSSRSILPEDWRPSPLDIAFALSCGLNPAAMADTFADHYRATGASRADWSAVWRNWCRREPLFSRKRSSGDRFARNEAGRSSAAADLLAQLDAYEANPVDMPLRLAQLAA